MDYRTKEQLEDFLESHTFNFGPNAFWSDGSSETALTTICRITSADDKIYHDGVYEIQKYVKGGKGKMVSHNGTETEMEIDDGVISPLFAYAVKTIGMDSIKKFTEERLERHHKRKQEEKVKDLREVQKQRSKSMEDLFTAKLQVFDIEEVKNSKNKKLRGKIRKSKNIYELNAYTTMLLMEENEIK